MRSRMMLPMHSGADEETTNLVTAQKKKYIVDCIEQLERDASLNQDDKLRRKKLDALVSLQALNEQDDDGVVTGIDFICSGAWFWVSWGGACLFFFFIGWLFYIRGSFDFDDFGVSMQSFVGFPIAENAPDGTEDVHWWRFKNIVCGLMLGLVFGFLDNFGLFFGSSTLDVFFYPRGMVFAKNVLPPNTPETTYHEYANDMMAGFGNTFSDMMGVVLGSAALEIAKSGMGVEPTFWIGDILSMMIGCLAGVLAPSIIKNNDAIDDMMPKITSYVVMGGLLLGIIFSGFSGAAFVYIATALIAIAIIASFILLVYAFVEDIRGVNKKLAATPSTRNPVAVRATTRRKR